MIDLKEFPAIIKLMDEGVKKEIENESRVWNEHLYLTEEYKGTELDRYPLSPSQFGKCALALSRNLSHYTSHSEYPRSGEHITPRVSRIFKRGHLLESALIEDIEKYTPFKVVDRQKRVTVFTLNDGTAITGSIDGIAVSPKGVRILLDFKSKGAFYSAGFQDSIQQFFAELQQTGLVEEIGDTSYYITDPKGLFDLISLDEFFVDYLLQLNSYGHAEQCDFVSLYYENKNTCANYEVRWVPNADLVDYCKTKMQFVYDSKADPESVPKEFQLGSARCRLCEHNERCWGKYEPKSNRVAVAALPEEMAEELDQNIIHEIAMNKTMEEVLQYMAKKDLTRVTTKNGTYERKFLKSPKPHYELRLVK